ncbi:MAG: hypothetical protein AAFV95_27605 [Bacteroidota bacterium]
MKQLYSQKKRVGYTDLIDQVFAIIDSRIQYLEYENDQMLRGCFDGPAPSDTEQTDSKPSGSGGIVHHFDTFMAHARDIGRSLKLLFFLRTHLLRENARIVLDLLTNNRYLKYNEEHLGFLLQLGRWN